ncbi:MAG: DUF3883 domain-containing protein [Acidiferrobacterales bacterium]|nr:DUF3883 domain-containing protein [Acidiferrobacterales bacterium]
MNQQLTNPSGTDWSGWEIDLIVEDYFDMLNKELQGIAFRKVDHNRKIQSLTGRTKGSVEFKYRNVSAVLEIIGCPQIKGYLPAKNIQKALLPGVERHLDQYAHSWVDTSPLDSLQRASAGDYADEIEIIRKPEPISRKHPMDKEVTRLVRKFDPDTGNELARNIGLLGEQRVFHSEQVRLRNEGRNDLARKVRWVSQEDGDGAGYDIRSFTSAGVERFLEVKTTAGNERAPFFLSKNEKEFSDENPEHSRIFRVFDLPTVPRAFKLKPPLENAVDLTPLNFRADLR